MKKAKSVKIDLNELSKKNPKIDTKHLAHTLKILGELQKHGVNIGPNYNLDSPFSQPQPTSSNPHVAGSILQSK